jgi:hypothetical protein
MKNLFLILLFIPIVFSCSSDDLTDIKPVDQIVGKWYFSTYTIDNVDTDYDECKQKGYFLFLNNGTGQEIIHHNNSTYGCRLDSTKNLTWSFDDNEYDIKTFGEGSYAGVSSFGITYQYYGKISNEFLKIPVGYNETINLKKE